MGLLQEWESQRRKGVSHETLIARLRGGSGNDTDDDDDTEPNDEPTDEPKKPIAKRKAKASKKSKGSKRAKALESPEQIAANVSLAVAKARAQGSGSHVAGLSDPRLPTLRQSDQNFSAGGRPEEFLLQSAGYQNGEELAAHARVARHVRDRAQAAPTNALQRQLDALGIPHTSSLSSLESLRAAAKRKAQSGEGPELPAVMFGRREGDAA
jgi:hypothetical protein